MRREILFLSILSSIFFVTQISGQSKVGTAGAQFLEIGVSARAFGMAEAFVAIANDASALFYNPGGVARVGQREFIATHTKLPASVNYEYAGFVYPISRVGGTVGVFFSALTMDDMKRTVPGLSDDGWDGTYFTATGYVGGMTYSRYLTDKFSTGITVKVIRDKLEEYGANGFGVDVGTLYDTGFYGLKVGMVVTNFGPDMKFIKESFPLPMNFKFGISSDIFKKKDHKLLVDIEGSHPNDNEERGMWGIEYSYKNLFYLRGGRKIHYDTERYSFGAGFTVPTKLVKVKIDYSYTDWKWMTEMHRGSVGFVF